tara:strand:- start:241 stop:474 length:234 start_codon:yes stop_codon:yes gene_type:complete
MDILQETSLKLLADPHKLKCIKKYYGEDKLKNELERKFNYLLTNQLYQHLIETIRSELIIDSVIRDIINQVSLNHNP